MLHWSERNSFEGKKKNLNEFEKHEEKETRRSNNNLINILGNLIFFITYVNWSIKATKRIKQVDYKLCDDNGKNECRMNWSFMKIEFICYLWIKLQDVTSMKIF